MQGTTLYSQTDVALLLGVSEAWLERARWAGTGPAFIKVGRAVRYRAEDLNSYILLNRCIETRKETT